MDTTPRSPLSRPRAAFAPARADSGFTLVDLVVVIAVAAILASLAAPPFASFIASQRASAAATDLYAALTMARSEATKRNTNVTLAPVSGGWQNGWTIANPMADGTYILNHGALTGAEVTGPDAVVYQRSGRIRGAAASFALTMSTGAAAARRCVLTDLSGRPYIQPC